MAIVAAPVMAQDAYALGGKGVDVLGKGIFESDGGGFGFPFVTDTNFDSITVGNDNARAIEWGGIFPFVPAPAKAENNLEIKKNQQVGPCECCERGCHPGPNPPNPGSLAGSNYCGDPLNCTCQDCCTTINMDQVHVGNRDAQAIGSASAVNNVKLVLNQAP